MNLNFLSPKSYHLKPNQKGFTLIELLVVIAIIGILSGIVLASLNNARTKANDAKIKAQVSSVRAAAETYYSTNLNYGPANTTDDCTVAMWTDVPTGLVNLVAAGNYPAGVTITCTTDRTAAAAATKYAFSVGPLSTNTNDYACADSTGASKVSTQTGTDVGITSSACN